MENTKPDNFGLLIMKTIPQAEKRRLLAMIHIAKKSMTSSGRFREDDDYRDFLEEHTGKRSAAKMSIAELVTVIEAFETMGWSRSANSGKSPRSRDKKEKTQADKCVALWITLKNQGIVRNGSHQALGRFVMRFLGGNLRVMPGVDPLDAATPKQLSSVIVALEAMADGGTNSGKA